MNNARDFAFCDCGKAPLIAVRELGGYPCRIYQCPECGDEIVQGRQRSSSHDFMAATG